MTQAGDAFRQILSEGIEAGVDVNDIAHVGGVTERVVRKWAAGQAKPSVQVQSAVAQWVKKQICPHPDSKCRLAECCYICQNAALKSASYNG